MEARQNSKYLKWRAGNALNYRKFTCFVRRENLQALDVVKGGRVSICFWIFLSDES